ncbi:c-type cytochrome [Methylococcus sp. EFPC2]|nr:c-type cytochrome [Methylococcus sp. EFPC2]
MLGVLVFACAGTAYANEELAKAKGCLNCHAIDVKKVGPAYREVAKKYEGQADAAARLGDKIVQGGAGAWGTLPMPPNPAVKPEEAKQLANWILNLK